MQNNPLFPAAPPPAAGGGLEVAPLRQGDLPAVAALERECFGENAWSAASLLSEMELPGAVLLCAREGGRVAGYAGMRTAAGEGYINNIAVNPARRRRGVGMALLRGLAQEGRRQGLRFLTLEVRVSNEPARKLYERASFHLVGRRRGFYRHPTEDALLLTLDL